MPAEEEMRHLHKQCFSMEAHDIATAIKEAIQEGRGLVLTSRPFGCCWVNRLTTVTVEEGK